MKTLGINSKLPQLTHINAHQSFWNLILYGDHFKEINQLQVQIEENGK